MRRDTPTAGGSAATTVAPELPDPAKPSLGKRSVTWALGLFRHLELTTARPLLFFWFGARFLVFLVWVLVSPSTQGDVLYYYDNITRMFSAGPGVTMREYPTPVLWFLTLPWLLGFGTARGFVIAFVLLMLALDATFALGLWRYGGRLRAHAVTYWVLFLTFCGPTVYMRFDLVTCVLAGWGLLFLMHRHAGVAGTLAGVGAAIKLWPALLWPALCGGTARQKLKATLGFWITGGALALASLLWAGWDRLVSPLSWLSGRGLQVESVWASVPMLMRALGLGDYAVAISRFQAFEVYGTGVGFWLQAASIATVVGLVVIVAAFALWIWRGHGHLMEAAALILLVIVTMIVTNKTFSPQYLFWLGGPMAAAFCVLGVRQRDSLSYRLDRRRLWTTSVLLLVATFLTVLVYPIAYTPLVRDGRMSYLRIPVTLVLVARNLVTVVLLITIIQWISAFLSPTAIRRVRANRWRDADETLLEPAIDPPRICYETGMTVIGEHDFTS